MDIISCGTPFACFIGVQEGAFIEVFIVKMVFQLQLRYTAINMQSFFPYPKVNCLLNIA